MQKPVIVTRPHTPTRTPPSISAAVASTVNSSPTTSTRRCQLEGAAARVGFGAAPAPHQVAQAVAPEQVERVSVGRGDGADWDKATIRVAD